MLKRKKRKKIDLNLSKVLQAVGQGPDIEKSNQDQDLSQRTKIRKAKKIKKMKRMTFKFKIKFNSNRIFKFRIINNN